jgi:hypothetical protein
MTPTESTVPVTPFPAIASLRSAAAEALLAGALVLSDVQREKSWNQDITKASEERFRKSLDLLREALSQ